MSNTIEDIKKSLKEIHVGIEKRNQEFEKMQKVLRAIAITADDAMSVPGTPGKALISISWIKKLAERALGEEDD